MSDEITVAGNKYISSKRAARETGYAQDYIGQLARAGKLDAKRVGGLWFVDKDSLLGYETGSKRNNSDFKVQSNRPQEKTLVAFDGKEYISASRASQITGYNQDYIGQLARSGKVLSRQVGKRWYVESDALMSHKREKDALLAGVQVESVGIQRTFEVNTLPKSHSMDDEIMHYEQDKADLIPELEKPSIPVAPLVEIPVPQAISASVAHNEHVVPIRKVHHDIKVDNVSSQKSSVRKDGITMYRAKNTGTHAIIFYAVFSLAIVAALVLIALAVTSRGETQTPLRSVPEIASLIEWGEDILSPELVYIRVR